MRRAFSMAAAAVKTKSGLSTKPLVMCGPSGAGKSVLIKKLQEEFPGEFGFSVSHTTRGPREGEVDGKDYHFSTHEVMNKMKDEGGFVESANVHGNMYGTSVKAVEDVRSAGQVCILDIDTQGVQSLKAAGTLDPRYVFVKPPSMEILEKRLRGRGTEAEEKILVRLGNAQKEMEYGDAPGNFDVVIVNDDLDKAYGELKAYVTKAD